MQADLGQGGLVVLELDDLAAGRGAEAVAVRDNQSAAALDELGEVVVVDLGADDGDSRTVGVDLVGFALSQLLQRLAQVGQNQALGTRVGDQVEHMELIAGDDGVVRLAHLGDLGEDPADLVMLLNGFADGLIGGVDAELFGQLVEHVDAHLLDIGIQRIVGDLEGDVTVGHKEVGRLVDPEDLEVLHGAVHHGAGVHTDHGVQELVAALNAALHQSTGVLAGVVGHVVGGDVDGAGVGGAQSHGEAVADVEQSFGDMVAGVAEADVALGLSLFDQLIIGVLKQVFKEDKMLKIFQMLHLFYRISMFWSASFTPLSIAESAGSSRTLLPMMSFAAKALSAGI